MTDFARILGSVVRCEYDPDLHRLCPDIYDTGTISFMSYGTEEPRCARKEADLLILGREPIHLAFRCRRLNPLGRLLYLHILPALRRRKARS